VKWVRYINPTDKNDYALSTCVFGDYIAVVGKADRYPYVVLLEILAIFSIPVVNVQPQGVIHSGTI